MMLESWNDPNFCITKNIFTNVHKLLMQNFKFTIIIVLVSDDFARSPGHYRNFPISA